jgi:hypothetical protein
LVLVGVSVCVGVFVAIGVNDAVGVLVAVAVAVGVFVGPAGVAVGVFVAVAVGTGAPPPSWTRLSKLVSQPLLLPTVTVVQVLPQPVVSVATCPAPTLV